MSHVDEGALHAYLDGALDEYPSGQARRIRAHLERCERCAEALAEASRVRDTAETILATPELNVAPPPLEELKRLARSSTSDGRRPRSGFYRLGWAASVVLALGVGWMLRGGQRIDPTGTDRSALASREAESAAAPASVPAPELESEVAPPPGRMADAAPMVQDRVASTPGDLPAAPEPPVVPSLEISSELPAADEVRVALEDAEPLAATGDTGVAAMPQVSEFVASAESASPAPEPETAPADRSTSLSSSGARLELSSRVEGGVAGAFDEAPARTAGPSNDVDGAETGSLVVPGLDVLSIVWREEGVTPAGVRVLQRLDDGGVLELIHLPEGVAPEVLDPVEPGVSELAVPRGSGWLILRAPVGEDALADLLRRLEAAPPV
ncbi:MAG: zf-HC2 domain-containing protein [Gemmatimonadota bacterium]